MSDATENYSIVFGDLFEQQVDAIVNPYNRNRWPWWMLMPGGVSGQLKKKGGTLPYRQLAKHGLLRPGQAVLTDGGRLPYKVIHVACIGMTGKSSQEIVTGSVHWSIAVAKENGLKTIAMPLLASGHGSLSPEKSLQYIKEAVEEADSPDVHVVITLPKEKQSNP